MKNQLEKNDETKITWDNAKFLGIDIFESYANTAKDFAGEINRIIEHESNNLSFANITIGVICGLGGNAVDAILTACELSKNNKLNITVYLIGRTTNTTSDFFMSAWKLLESVCKKNKNISYKQEVYAQDIQQHSIILEGLTGSGLEGNKLNKRFKDVIARISHFDTTIIAIDLPTLHYSPDHVISIDYPKTKDAIVINSHLPQELKLFCGPGERIALWKSKQTTHKTKNGSLIALTTKEIKYKPNYANFFSYNLANVLDDYFFEKNLEEVDSIYITDIPKTFAYNSIVNSVIRTFGTKKFIVNLDCANGLNFEDLPKGSILGISSNKIVSIFGTGSNIGTIKTHAIKNKFNFVVYGFNLNLFGANGDFRSVALQKNISLDQLLLEVAEYSTKNDEWLSLRAGVS